MKIPFFRVIEMNATGLKYEPGRGCPVSTGKWFLLLVFIVSALLIFSAEYAVADGRNGTGKDPAMGSYAEPVNTFTGELYNYYAPDIDLGGPLPLYFSRYYSSHLAIKSTTGRLGDNWRHNFEMELITYGNPINFVKVIDNVGLSIGFLEVSGNWVRSGAVAYQLVQSGPNFIMSDPRDGLLYTFDTATGRLISIMDGKGNTLTITYQGSDLKTVSDGLTRVLFFTYDVNGKLSAVGDGVRQVSFGYTGNDLTSATDLRGNTTNYNHITGSWYWGSLMSLWTLPRGNTPYSQTYDAFDNVGSQTDADTNTHTFIYNPIPFGGTGDTIMTDPLGNTRVHTHSDQGKLLAHRSEDLLAINMTYDANGRRNSIIDRMGDTTSYTYHVPSGRIDSKTNADGTTSGYSYTARPFGGLTLYDLTTMTHEDGTTESLGYDPMGNVISYTDQIGNAGTSTYNGNGQPLITTNLAGGITTNTYNLDATLNDTTDPAGHTTTFGYDALKHLDLITFADFNNQAFTYDAEDRLLSSTDENGNTTTYSYDANGNLATSTDPLGNTAAFAYDGNDHLLSTTDPLGGVVSYTYDAMERPETATDENSNTTINGYDNRGRLTTVTFPRGNSNSFTYDAETVKTSASDGLGNTTTYTTDQMGRITGESSPMGNLIQFGYDAVGRMISTTNQLGFTTVLNRGLRGLLTGINLPGGVISTTYIRDSLGNITQVTDPNGNNWLSSFNNQGLRTSRIDPLGNVRAMTYDNRYGPSTITYADGIIQTLDSDSTGNLTSRSYSGGGPVFNYTYDANNLLVSANDGPGTPDNLTQSYDALGYVSNSNGIVISRDAGGRITGMDMKPATGKVVTYAYDVNDNLISVTDWAGGFTTFSYDAADRLTGITRPVANGINTGYTYDNDSHLTGITEGTISTISLTRDAVGQIIQATRNNPLTASTAGLTSTTHSFDAASQITTTGFVYDVRGRLMNDGTRAFAWDAVSRLSSVTEGAVTTTYTYDSLGQRLSRTANGVTRNYVWNNALGLSSISIERDAANNDLRYFIHTPAGELLYSIDAVSNARNFYHFDEMGNNIAVTDDSGAVIGSYAYSPYGTVIASTGTIDNPFTWQGESGVMDESNGLYYMRARYYDSNIGRFISSDQVKSIRPESINPYQYAFGNPMGFTDPLGLSPSEKCVCHDEDKIRSKGGKFPGCSNRGMLPPGKEWDEFYDAYTMLVVWNIIQGWEWTRIGNIIINTMRGYGLGKAPKGLCDEWAVSIRTRLQSLLPDGWILSRVTRYSERWAFGDWLNVKTREWYTGESFAARHQAVGLIDPNGCVVGILDPHSSGGSKDGDPAIYSFTDWKRWRASTISWTDGSPWIPKIFWQPISKREAPNTKEPKEEDPKKKGK